MKVSIVEWEIADTGSVPVTVTVYWPTLPLHVSVDVPDVPRVMLVGLREQAMPVVGDIEDVRSIVPVKPLTDATVIVDVPAVPEFTFTVDGVLVMLKLGKLLGGVTVTVIVTL